MDGLTLMSLALLPAGLLQALLTWAAGWRAGGVWLASSLIGYFVYSFAQLGWKADTLMIFWPFATLLLIWAALVCLIKIAVSYIRGRGFPS
jgi:hypothetical protein